MLTGSVLSGIAVSIAVAQSPVNNASPWRYLTYQLPWVNLPSILAVWRQVVQQITSNVWVETETRGCNFGFVTTSDGIVMVDSPHKPT
ncbi:MAG: hypothetical protein VX264_05245, partial [Chloroflexota bacterium]|nr:hypothetical protein [Chloroflexota bacterium]